MRLHATLLTAYSIMSVFSPVAFGADDAKENAFQPVIDVWSKRSKAATSVHIKWKTKCWHWKDPDQVYERTELFAVQGLPRQKVRYDHLSLMVNPEDDQQLLVDFSKFYHDGEQSHLFFAETSFDQVVNLAAQAGLDIYKS